MGGWSRRNWLASLALAAAGQGATARAWQGQSKKSAVDKEKLPGGRKLALEDYEPKSMLHVPETKVSRARFPAIDFHTHLSWSARRGRVAAAHNNATPEEVLPIMDRKNVRIMVNLTGGYGNVLEQTIKYWQRPHPDRFVVFTEPDRKSTRLNSSHLVISYAVFCLK